MYIRILNKELKIKKEIENERKRNGMCVSFAQILRDELRTEEGYVDESDE
jgi:hypothetical protein